MKNTIRLIIVLIFVGGSLQAQWSLDTLSTAKYAMTATTINDKVLFAQGNLATGVSGNVEIYNATNDSWSVYPLSVNRNYPAPLVLGNKVFYAGGQFAWNSFSATIDIYNDATSSWSVSNLSLARKVGAAGVVGNKAIFAGGVARNADVYMFSNKVDIYNSANNTWSTNHISQPRSEISTATVGNKILFAGGVYMSTTTWQVVPTKKVDMYDNVNDIWTTALLSIARQNMSTAVVGNKVLFAGGWLYAASGAVLLKDRVDIYDASNNTWTTATLSTPRYGMQVSVIGNKVYFAGGTAKSNLLARRIDIYDASTNTWSVTNLPTSVKGYAKADLGNRIFYAGGALQPSNQLTKRINIYDVNTNTWSIDSMPVVSYSATSARVLNKALFAGGLTSVSAPITPVNRVDIYTDPNLRIGNSSALQINSSQLVSVYPNPFKDKIFIQLQSVDAPVTVSLYDLTGRIRNTFQLSSLQNEIDLSDLKSGMYFLKINETDKAERIVRIIKI